MKTETLQQIAYVRVGVALRGKVIPAEGDAAEVPLEWDWEAAIKHEIPPNFGRHWVGLVLQMRDLDPDKGVQWEQVIRTELEVRKSPNWLCPGQILFQPKGGRYFAVYLREVPYLAVASPHLFIIEVKAASLSRCLPEFLAWQLNQAPVMKQLEQSALGSTQLGVRAQQLKDVSVALPPISTQQQIVKTNRLIQQEITLHQQLIDNRRETLKSIAHQLTSQTEKND